MRLAFVALCLASLQAYSAYAINLQEPEEDCVPEELPQAEAEADTDSEFVDSVKELWSGMCG